MSDYSLKFTDEVAAMAVLMDGETLVYPNTDIIGIIYRNTGTNEEPVMVATDGFHVNVRTDEAPELDQYAVFPVTPFRVWA
jgi:hypothetical protein